MILGSNKAADLFIIDDVVIRPIETYKKNTKVYIIGKTMGNPLLVVLGRIKNNKIKYENIFYKDKLYNALIGYYYQRRGIKHVIDYNCPATTGDFYATGDFITLEQIQKYNFLDNNLFEI